MVQLAPSKDNTLYESGTGALSNGAGDFLFAGQTQNFNLTRRAVLSFDLVAAGIPAGATVTSVTLEMDVSRSQQANTENVSLHRLTQDWGEGTSNASANEGGGAPSTTGDATWIH